MKLNFLLLIDNGQNYLIQIPELPLLIMRTVLHGRQNGMSSFGILSENILKHINVCLSR